MNSKVKRYAFRLSQLSEVMGGQLEVIEYSGDGLPYVLATDYAALEAERERLRVKLMVIASAEPARHGIEWAKAIAAEGNGEPYAKWREAIDERDALAAENARLRAELEQSRDLIVEMSTHCNATALVADWLERNT